MPETLCQSCKKNPATVHLTEIIGGEKREMHYCEECAQQEGVSPLTPQSFFAQLVGSGPVEEDKSEEIVCTGCGLTSGEFRQRGRLGCGDCYKLFRDHLMQLLHKIHGSNQHLGKVPAQAGESLQAETELIQHKRDLARAIQHEEYEKAAHLRDRIRELEERTALESD